MSSIKIALKVDQLSENKVKLKLEIESNPLKPVYPPVWDSYKAEDPLIDESLPLFDIPGETIYPAQHPSSFWKRITNWFKFRKVR